MRKLKFIFALFGLSLLGMSFGVVRPSGKLTRAFEALEAYNYFEAKDLFYQTIRKDSVASSYGLSVIYGRNDNPFFQMDSSFKYIVQAIRIVPRLNESKKLDIATLGVDSVALANQLIYVDSCFYELAYKGNEVDGWNLYIEDHQSEPYLKQAIAKRNELAFAEVVRENSSAGFEDFMNMYPDAKQFSSAEENYHKRIFEEFIGSGDISAYRSFIAQYPESPYRNEAENKVYELSTGEETVESYERFITENPDNVNTSKAWRQIYALEISELNAKTIAAFSLKYPKYPFSDELLSEFQAAVTVYYPIEQNELWGFVDDKGVVKIPCSYQWVEPFSENLAAAGTEDEVIFINKSGTVVVQDALEDAYSFKSGFVVAMRDDKMGIVNRYGEWVVAPTYDDMGEYSEGYFYALQNGKYGFLNEAGEMAIAFQYEDATDFKKGLAVVETDSGVGFINNLGVQISKFKYDWIEPFKADVDLVRCKIDNKYGLLDSLGFEVVKVQYDHIGDFSEGLALAEADGKYGFINTRGDTVVAFTYTYSTEAFKNSFFKDGYAKVYQGNKVGVIDTLGNKVFPAMFQDIGPFDGKLVSVSKNGKWGYADLKINLAIPYEYSEAQSFIDTLAIVKEKSLFGVIDTLGNNVIPCVFETMKKVGNLYLISDTAYGLIDIKGDTIVPLQYQRAEIMDSKVLRLYEDEEQFSYYDFVRQKFIWKPSDN